MMVAWSDVQGTCTITMVELSYFDARYSVLIAIDIDTHKE
jgi:hypothetical protein